MSTLKLSLQIQKNYMGQKGGLLNISYIKKGFLIKNQKTQLKQHAL